MILGEAVVMENQQLSVLYTFHFNGEGTSDQVDMAGKYLAFDCEMVFFF